MLEHNSKLISLLFFYFKLFVVFAFLVYVVVLFGIRLRKFDHNDPVPNIKNIAAENSKAFREFAATMKTGLYIKNFPTFHMNKNNFTVDATMWFEFYGSQLSLDVIEKFTFLDARIISKSAPDIKINKDKLLVTYQIVFDVKGNLNYKNFPLANHMLSIVMVNYSIMTNEMIFDDLDKSNSFILSPEISGVEWGVHATNNFPGMIVASLDDHVKDKSVEYPAIGFTITFIRKSFKDLLVLFMPIFAAALFAWLSLLMNVSNEVGRFSLSITAFTAILGYRFVIEQVSPQVGYFTLLDNFYLAVLALCFFVFVFHLVITAMWYVIDKKRSTDEAQGLLVEAAVAPSTLTSDSLKLVMDIAFCISGVTLYGATLYFLFY